MQYNSMIPILLVTDKKRSINKYLTNLEKEKKTIIIDIVPQTTEYSINQIRELTKETRVFHPEKRIYLLTDFEKSSIPAQNAFLKLLEEPPQNTLFVLTAKSAYNLLPTIISRTRIVVLDKAVNETIEPTIQHELSQFLQNKNFKIIGSNCFLATTKEKAANILDQIILFFQSRLLTDKLATTILKETIKIRSLLEYNNLNPQLSIDHLLIFIRKSYSIK